MIEKKDQSDFTKDVCYEANLMRGLNHQNIVKVFDVIESDKMLYIVLEFAKGDLFDYIKFNGYIEEVTAKEQFKGLLEAISYLHQKNVIHRDIKPENILLTSKDIKTCQFKITDFGLSRLVADESLMRTICGTPLYGAPEIFNAEITGYTGAVDVWSLGCVLFVMLSGSPPFSQGNMEAISTGTFAFHPTSLWSKISSPAKDLINQMLKVTSTDRVSVDEACYSDWFTNTEGLKRKFSNSEEIHKSVLNRKCGH